MLLGGRNMKPLCITRIRRGLSFHLISLALLLGACLYVPELEQAEVIDIIGGIPENATNLYTYGASSLDAMGLARFEIPSVEVDAYVRSLGIDEPLVEGFSPFLRTSLYDQFPWWDAPIKRSEGNFRGLTTTIDNLWNYSIVVVENGATARVYIEVFSF
jgi:hypothetical protein